MYPFVHPEKLAKIDGLLMPAKKKRKRKPKGTDKEGAPSTPEERAWRTYEMRRSRQMNNVQLPGSSDMRG